MELQVNLEANIINAEVNKANEEGDCSAFAHTKFQPSKYFLIIKINFYVAIRLEDFTLRQQNLVLI
jgi:hypothetical protein